MRGLASRALGLFIAPAAPGDAAPGPAAAFGVPATPAPATPLAGAPTATTATRPLAGAPTAPTAATAATATTPLAGAPAAPTSPAPFAGAPTAVDPDLAATAGADPPRAAVLGDRASAPPLAAALATELRVRARRPTALVCVWGAGVQPPPPGAAPAAPARALATRLAEQGHDAIARGRLAWIALPPAPQAAADGLVRLSATVEAPVVLALAGARPAALDPLLADLDLVLVSPPAGMSSAAVDLALAELARATASVIVRRPLPRGSSRWLALAGRGRLRGDRADLHAALGGGT